MTTTLPVLNRIQHHLPTAPALPGNHTERENTYTNAVFAAVVFLQSRLTGHDPSAAERAAMAILDLEKTRLRHSRKISGTDEPFDAPLLPMGCIDPPSDYIPGERSYDDDDEDEREEDEYEDEDEEEDECECECECDLEEEEIEADPEESEEEVAADATGWKPLKFTAKQRAEIERVFEDYRLERIKCEKALREKAARERAQPEIRIFTFGPDESANTLRANSSGLALPERQSDAARECTPPDPSESR
jgi:hypothetical protein